MIDRIVEGGKRKESMMNRNRKKGRKKNRKWQDKELQNSPTEGMKEGRYWLTFE